MDVLWNLGSNVIKIDLLCNVEDYLTFLIFVKSNSFQGSYNFCISRRNIIELIRQINNGKNLVEIQDYDSDSFIRFEKINDFVIVVMA